ncbi:MAG: hypothetical protein J0M19_16655 [Sphingomonadales bacterium]|nr:hypothetical protein [Sphingomonadales bacterium]
MRSLAITLATAAALLGTATLDAKPRLTPQQRLDKILDGRVAGKPVHCIPSHQTRDMQVLDKTAIVYGWGETVYVNVPKNAQDLDDDDIMVTRTTGSQLCDLDIVHTVDRTGGFTNGFVSLGEFVPYKRVPKVATAD